MTVRFKCQSEYQKSYGVPRSRSVSPQRCTPLAGIRSDHMGVSREPSLHRRRKLGLAKSCTSLLYPSDQHHLNPEPSSHAHRTGPSAASRSHSVQRKEPSLVPGPPTPPEFRSEPDSPLESEPPIGPRPTEEPARQEKSRHAAGTGPSAEPGAAGKSTKPRPSRPGSQSRPSHPVSSAANEVDVALLKKAGLRSGGQRSGGQRSEYHRQFSWKKPVAAASPILTAEQAVYSSSRSVPPSKKHPVTMETEYRRSFQGLAPPSGPRLRKHLEHQRVPLFHTHMKNKKRRESRHKPRPDYDVTNHLDDDATPPPQVHRGHRVTEDGGGAATDGDAPQVRTHDEGWGHTLRDGVKELRQQAMSYRRRAWGTNFSRDHLNQLRSEHNALWEPTDTSVTDPPTPRINLDLSPDPDSRSVSCVEALDLASRSSQRSSVAVSGEINDTNKNTQIKAQRRPGRPAETRPAWGDDEDDDDGDEDEDEDDDEDEGGRNTDEEEEGRLPTPRLRMRPVQRTHHDLTTPATGGAILVGKLRSSDTSSPVKQRSVSAFSTAAWADATVNSPSKRTEAWSENNPHPSGPASPEHKAASKPIRMKQTPAPPAALPPPLHGFHGMLRHPDFQHNGSQITSVESQQKQDSPSLLFTSLTLSVKGDLGLRFRDPSCPGGRCCDEDERLSVMSWRSAASCSAASAVLERAQKRHEDFWGKR